MLLLVPLYRLRPDQNIGTWIWHGSKIKNFLQSSRRIQVAQAYTCVHDQTPGLSGSTRVASCLATGTHSCATNMESPGKVMSRLYACALHWVYFETTSVCMHLNMWLMSRYSAGSLWQTTIFACCLSQLINTHFCGEETTSTKDTCWKPCEYKHTHTHRYVKRNTTITNGGGLGLVEAPTHTHAHTLC